VITRSDEKPNYELFEPDERIALLERIVRIFFNRIEANADTLRTKLGKNFSLFWDDMLPGLLGIVFELVPYRGSGNQERIRIVCHLEILQTAFEESSGDYEQLISQIAKMKGASRHNI
jgi:hypothetical protein